MSDVNYKFNIPEDIYGLCVSGVDLQILSSDSVRIIEAYAFQDGVLSEIQIRVLFQCDADLRAVIPEAPASVREYLLRLHEGVLEVIRKLRDAEDKSLRDRSQL